MSESLTSGEFRMTAADFQRIAATIYEAAGITLPPSKASLVYSRLAKRLRALGFKTFGDYCRWIETEGGAEERKSLLSALTTNVTHFFREGHHFEILERRVLPELIKHAEQGGRVRLWSAACSSGEEPYSMAMTVLSAAPKAARYNLKILATDLDPMVLEQARRGIYPEDAMTRLPEATRRRFFKSVQDGRHKAFSVVDEVRRLIVFKELNLIRPWPVKGPFDAVFCRNVVIYFDEPTKEAVWQRFAAVIGDGGWLFVGHSERVSGPAVRVFRNEGPTAYRRRS